MRLAYTSTNPLLQHAALLLSSGARNGLYGRGYVELTKHFQCFQTFSDLPNVFICFNLFRVFKTFSVFFQHFQMFPNIFRCFQTCSDVPQRFQICPTIFRCFPTFSDFTHPPHFLLGPTKNTLGPVDLFGPKKEAIFVMLGLW